MDFIKSILPDGVLRSWVLATGRHVATAASGVVLTYLIAHGAKQADADTIAQAIGAIVLGLCSYGYSLWDVKNVDKKISTAKNETAVTISTAVKADPKVSKEVTAASGSPDAMNDLIARLKAGQL